MDKAYIESAGQINHHKPVLKPVIGADSFDDLDAVEQEVKGLRQQLNSADRDQTRRLIGQLKALSGRLPPHSRKAKRSASVILATITQAEQQLEALSDEVDRRVGDRYAQQLLAMAVYTTLSGKAKGFVDAIDAKSTYEIKPVSADGFVVAPSKAEVIEGEELRQHFSIIKFHTMTEADKKDVLSKAFGVNETADSVSGDTKVLQTERVELLELHHALRDMEAYKAAGRLGKSQGNLQGAVVSIALDHDSFVMAHKHVDALVLAYDRLLLKPGDADAIAEIKLARAMMKKTLKEDIMDRILLGGSSGGDKPIEILPMPTPAFSLGVPSLLP